MIWLALFAACGSLDNDRREALADAHAVITSDYRAFSESTTVLASASKALCDSANEGNLRTARDAWWESRRLFKQTDVVRFGPIVELPDRLGPPIDFWPARTAAVDALIAGDASLDPASFAELGAATRGMPAIEYVLYDDDALLRFTEQPRRCEFIIGASEDLAVNAAQLTLAWGSWHDRLVDPDGTPYASRQAVLDEWVNRVAFAAEDIRVERLGAALGDATGNGTRPDALESRFSGRSLMDARDTLDGAHAVLLTLLPLADNPEVTQTVVTAYDTAARRLSDIPEPLQTAIVVEPEIVLRAQDALRAYQVAVQVDAAQALSVSVTFNDNDGD